MRRSGLLLEESGTRGYGEADGRRGCGWGLRERQFVIPGGTVCFFALCSFFRISVLVRLWRFACSELVLLRLTEIR